MKVKVARTVIDKDKLDSTIDTYDTVHYDQAAYLIMNSDTATIANEELSKQYFDHIVGGELGMYRGRKVLIDESLEFGEVDVR